MSKNKLKKNIKQVNKAINKRCQENVISKKKLCIAKDC
jgi:hypothetical protein